MLEVYSRPYPYINGYLNITDFIKFNCIYKYCAKFQPGANSPLKLVKSGHKILLNQNTRALTLILCYYNFLPGGWMKDNQVCRI